MGARDMHGMVAFGTLLGQRGYVCVSTEYRLSGEAPWPRSDPRRQGRPPLDARHGAT